MPLEPVYADGSGAAAPALPVGAVDVRSDRQQLIGMRVEPAVRREVTATLRVLGRVAVDEGRLFRVFSVTEGWIRELGAATTGSLVSKDELLAAYYSQEILGPQQAFIYALEALDRFIASGTASTEQIELNEKNVRNTRQTLYNLGMGPTQVEDIARLRQVIPHIQVRAPATGFVLARNVSMGQRFDRTAELYTIADLSRVWILADVFEGDAAAFVPGAKARVRLGGRTETLTATVSRVLPRFDPASRTLKVRLEAANPGYVFRPDVYVDVELETRRPEAVVVPSSAVLDSGLESKVFVERGEGVFEPRRVTTGWRHGGLVAIDEGLAPGERVVVTGNFLLDSESRMRLAGATPDPSPAPKGEMPAKDPVCGMDVDRAAARAAGRTSEHGGETYYFCAPGCKKAFDADPAALLARRGDDGR
jgi:Cu(I)/Ag(I) efflux system membrane fusion protein